MYIDNERREEIEAKNETRKRTRENREKMERERKRNLLITALFSSNYVYVRTRGRSHAVFVNAHSA